VEARERARAGEAFPALVAAYSDEPGAAAREGDLGGARGKALPPAIAAALEKLAVGAISDVVESPFGFHVLVRTR
jgi:parvulin-like peptidyl-prolyl isomerase